MVQKGEQKVVSLFGDDDNRISLWLNRFMDEEIRGIRTPNIERKIELQLNRFLVFFRQRYGHEKVSAITKRDVVSWVRELYGDPDDPRLAAATVNNHKTHAALFLKWLSLRAPHLLPENPAKGRELRDIQLPAPEPRALTEGQYISLVNVCDRLERFHMVKGRAWKGKQAPVRKNGRPKRDRAIVFMFLMTGIRRAMLRDLNLDQLEPNDPESLRSVRKARLVRIRGKGKTEQVKYLDYDLRIALADYLEHERPLDAAEDTKALFLAGQTGSQGRMSLVRLNDIVARIGLLHDAEQPDPQRHISPLTPHDLRHTYAFWLSEETKGDREALQLELGHRNDRYLGVYTNPPEEQRIKTMEKMYPKLK